MKTPRSFLLPLLAMLVLSPACRQAENRQVQQYSIEQFMNTEAIGGSSFSHDDKLVLYSSRKTGIFNAFTVPVEGGDPAQLTNSTTNSIFILSFFPADNRILYRSDRGGNEINHIYVRNEDGTTRDLTPDSAARAEFAGWSHDRKSFFYSSNKRDPRYFDLYEMDIATSTPLMVYKNDTGLDFTAISNDKRYLALVKTITTNNNEMYLFDRQAEEMKHLSPHTGDASYSPEDFSVDSKSLYFLTDEGASSPT